jgi:hypothetical protein
VECVEKKYRHSIILIVPFFGPFPNYFDLWLKSCELNDSIRWAVFTDNQTVSQLPQNVQLYNVEFEDFITFVDKKLDCRVNIPKPYKICDIRPAFGIIFEEYIRGYDFWGYCDLDMIFGDIRAFITDEILDRYDKVLNRGALSLYRNTDECNQYFRLNHPTVNYLSVFNSEKHYGFDEWTGIYELLKYHGIEQFHGDFIADIHPHRMRFHTTINDHPCQVFYWEDGKVYHEYIHKGGRYKREVCYIHMQKRKFPPHAFNPNNIQSFFVTPNGFKPKSSDVDGLLSFIEHNMWNVGHAIKFNYKRLMRHIKDIN